MFLICFILEYIGCYRLEDAYIAFSQPGSSKSDVIDGRTENELLLEKDLAMKFLPILHLESKSIWFEKRGLNCQILVGTYRTGEYIHSHTIIHVSDNLSQDTTTSNAILKDCVDRLKANNPNLLKAYVMSDNAGWFHTVERIFGIPCLKEHVT